MKSKRIGIYSGTFDPVHSGHITFALQSISAAKLDRIYFMPERRPRTKRHVEHFAHRVAMIKQAIKPHPLLKLIELVDISFSVNRTLPKLQAMFAGDQLVFLFGSDILDNILSWPKIDKLLNDNELVIGIRSNLDKQYLKQNVEIWKTKPRALYMFDSYNPNVTSSKIRYALRKRMSSNGSLKSVERYSNKHWLYISLAVD